MKKQILNLMVGAAILATTPAFSMDKDDDFYTKEVFTKKLKELQERHKEECIHNCQIIPLSIGLHTGIAERMYIVKGLNEEGNYARSNIKLIDLSYKIRGIKKILSEEAFPKPKGELSKELQEEMANIVALAATSPAFAMDEDQNLDPKRPAVKLHYQYGLLYQKPGVITREMAFSPSVVVDKNGDFCWK